MLCDLNVQQRLQLACAGALLALPWPSLSCRKAGWAAIVSIALFVMPSPVASAAS